MKIKLKRVYEKPSKDDGVRFLIDRLWPRGEKKKLTTEAQRTQREEKERAPLAQRYLSS